MKEYERLTIKDKDGNWQVWEDDYSHPFEALQTAIDKLAELEDKLENGTLIELPCKVGDTVWVIRVTDREIIKAVVTRIVFNTELSFEVADKYCEYIVFAKGIFRTKAEAEAKLKELKGEV